MNCIISIPKGKNILDFLQELDGKEMRTKEAWLFMRKDAVEELMCQCGHDVVAPALSLIDGNCSFVLNYGAVRSHIGIIAFHSEPCYDSTYYPTWFVITKLALDESSPVQIAFQYPSTTPNEAIFLALEE